MKQFFLTLLITAIWFSISAQSKSKTQGETVLSRGKIVYEQICLACHQADGSGVPSLNPPLIKTKWVLGEKKELIRIVVKGMDEEIEIDGESYHNVMPPLNYLTDQQIADVLTYVRTNFTNKANAVTTAEVKAWRSKEK